MEAAPVYGSASTDLTEGFKQASDCSLYLFFTVCEVRWSIFVAGTGYWLTEEILCCQDPWKYQKGMVMFLGIFLNSSFELFLQMLSLDINILQDNALFLAHLCPSFCRSRQARLL